MHAEPPPPREFSALESLEGALDWWREAGVDADFSDEPSGWLLEPESENSVAAPPPPAPRRARARRRCRAHSIGPPKTRTGSTTRHFPARSKNFANGG